jgi:hypothetical protein
LYLVGVSSLSEVVQADQVIPDDLIVQGAQCTGVPCLDGELFDGVTLKLKSDTPRLKFEDTSTSAGFPTTDWQLIANDSANGGANRFSIEDITNARVPFTIVGGAPNNALFIATNGQVGLKTTAPARDLHLATGSTPAVRLAQSSAGGFSAQTWDIGANEAHFFVRDVTNGDRLPFRIQPGAPTSSLHIAANGQVSLGFSIPQGKLHISGAATADVFNGIGPNLRTGPAFNFGYSGASFGQSSGFFNVRPDATASAPNPSLRFATANVQRVIIDRNQRVGIGLAGTNPIPTQRLDVDGNVRASGVFIAGATTLAVPDYVFAADYKLRPLKELATYVARERHLPEIPSAQEIKDRGVDLGEMQMLLLKKIEELTLYTLRQAETDLRQDKATEMQHQTLSALAARLTSLERRQKRSQLGQRKRK